MAITCSICPNYVSLAHGEEGFDDDEERGRCTLCPPTPTGSYHGDLALWPIVVASEEGCVFCKCRGCVIPQ